MQLETKKPVRPARHPALASLVKKSREPARHPALGNLVEGEGAAPSVGRAEGSVAIPADLRSELGGKRPPAGDCRSNQTIVT